MGRSHTPETRAKISAANTGKSPSLETRAKMSASRKRRGPASVETRAKISAGLTGRPRSVESRAKSALSKTGSKNPQWKGGRIITGLGGYIKIKSRDHPAADMKGYVLEHRIVMEKILGRYLTNSEKIHHRNGIKNDNRPENLELVVGHGAHYGYVICPYCRKHFLIQ